MKRNQLIAAGLLAAFGLAASAQNAPMPPAAPGAPMMGHGMDHEHGRMDPARMQQKMAKRLAALKQKLQITPAQEGAWTAYTESMKPPANWQRPDRAEFAKLTTPERIDRMRALRTEHMAQADKRADATKTFYAALTPEQKKVFDTESVRGHRGGPGWHHKG